MSDEKQKQAGWANKCTSACSQSFLEHTLKKKQPTNQTKKNIPQLQSRSLHEGDKKKAMIKAKSCMNVWKGVC